MIVVENQGDTDTNGCSNVSIVISVLSVLDEYECMQSIPTAYVFLHSVQNRSIYIYIINIISNNFELTTNVPNDILI